MKRGVKISFALVCLILIFGFVSAYPSFSLLKEDKDSKKAVIIYNVNPSEVLYEYPTIIQLNYIHGDFADLIGYLRNTKIMNVLYYNEDIDSETLRYIEEESGVNFRKLPRNLDGVQDLNSLETQELVDYPEIRISGNSIQEQSSVRVTFFTVLSVLALIAIIVAIRLIPDKKKRK